MLMNIFQSGLTWWLVVIVIHLCVCQALDDNDKYPSLQKRILCNMSGCRNNNGKREYHRNSKFHMFKRPIRTGKRADEPDLYDSYDVVPYDDWADNDQQEPMSKSGISAEVVPSDDNLPMYPADEDNGGRFLDPYELKARVMRLSKKYKLMKYAEELARYFKSSIKQETGSQSKVPDVITKYGNWLIRRKR